MTYLVQAGRVAELYGVTRATVYRWVHAGKFDVAPTVIPTPTRTRDRILFDAGQVARQYRREMLRGYPMKSKVRIERTERLKKFLLEGE